MTDLSAEGVELVFLVAAWILYGLEPWDIELVGAAFFEVLDECGPEFFLGLNGANAGHGFYGGVTFRVVCPESEALPEFHFGIFRG